MTEKSDQRQIVQTTCAEVLKFERGVLDVLIPDKEIRPIITCSPQESVRGIVFSQDGQFMAVCIDQSVLLWDLKFNQWVQNLSDGNLSRINHIEIDCGGKRLFSGDAYKIIEWDLQTGRIVRRIEINSRFAVSPDGRTLVSQVNVNHPFNRISLLDLDSGEEIRDFSMVQEWHSTAMALSPDGKRIAIAEFVSNCIRVYGLESEEKECTLSGHSGCVNTLAFTPDGEVLISGSDDCMIRFWRMTDGTCLRILPGHNGPVNCLAVSGDGERLLSAGGDKMIYVWDLKQDRLQHTLFGHEETITALAISPDGQMAASGGYDEQLYLWDLASGKAQNTLKVTTCCANRIACTTSGQFIASFSKDMRNLDLRRLTEDGCCHHGRIVFRSDSMKASVAIHPEGNCVAVGMLGRVCLYDPQTGLRQKMIDGFEGYVKLTAFSPDGRILIAGSGYSKEGKWCIHDLQTGESTFLRYEEDKKKLSLEGIAFMPDGKSFLAVGYDRFELWNLETGRREWTAGEAYSLYFTRVVAVHPLKKTFVSGGQIDGAIRVWDLETGKHLRTFTEHKRRVTALAFSRDGKLLLSGCEGGIVNYSDFETGRLLATAYIVDEGCLWTTPPDEYAENGWLYTDRPDLVSLAEIDPDDGSIEYLGQDDERFKNYMRIFNDGRMVMTRIYDWDRYQELLRLRTDNREQMAFAQIEARIAADRQYQLGSGRDPSIETEEN